MASIAVSTPTGSYDFFYERTIEQGDRPTVVFIHGFGCDHNDWQPQVAALAGSLPTIAVDLPGHGRSGADPANCTIEGAATAVSALLAELDIERAFLVGHSLGCRVVMQTALDSPARASGLVFVDGSWVGRGDPEREREETKAWMREAGFYKTVSGLFESMFLEGADPAMVQRIVDRANRLPEAVGIDYYASMRAWDAGKTERFIRANALPALVIQSTYLNVDAKRVALGAGESTPWLDLVREHTADARIEVLPDVGHFTMLEAAAETTEAIRAFVASH